MEHYVITIARGYGSGGRTLGKMLSKELNIPFYDREILRMASEESGINEQLFGKVDEKVKIPFFGPKEGVYKGQLLPPESDAFVSDDNLFNYQAKIIKDRARSESCIIIGRCADYILRDFPNVVRIFVYAPFEDCIARLKTMSYLSEDELKKKVKSIDKHRSDYYRYYTGKDWKNIENYDLCLNTSALDLDRWIEIIKAYTKAKLDISDLT